MFFENRRLLLLIIPICIAIAIYSIPFDGKQIISLDAPLTTTFDVLVNHVWKLHPFIIHIKELKKINSTCSYYEITYRFPFIPSFRINIPSTYYVQMNIDRENNCLTSIVDTQLNIMHAHHQYCMHRNTLKPTTTIITDQFHGKSWMIFKYYIRKTMLLSHKLTLDKLRKEMMIYSTE
ncbi:unnamed protein product [Rotaria sp. Silwood2]|nr:unnamed protein product [Rotaria sp. Silwood2]CAF2825799.1 unnamed protein product [Rotaria sp. Silwood2]CAF2986935.1 unnamed protein product [Rotaria sp. Silwood2]CAF3155638.1 unnamed protein product [Rotaria sp. Silwood2]CAF4143550.1 unnamed protein product [Rotaria sp. Silwood2]